MRSLAPTNLTNNLGIGRKFRGVFKGLTPLQSPSHILHSYILYLGTYLNICLRTYIYVSFSYQVFSSTHLWKYKEILFNEVTVRQIVFSGMLLELPKPFLIYYTMIYSIPTPQRAST